MQGKYIICDCCGKKIYFGDTIWYFGGYCGTYCSAECFGYAYGQEDELTEEYAEDCDCTVYDDEEVAKRKAEIKLEIQKLQNELANLEK